MRLRPLNDTVIIEPDSAMVPVDTDQEVLDAVNRGLIFLPEKNSVMKLSNKAKVVSYGPKCHYKFNHNQEILYNQFCGRPFWIEMEGQTYRIIKFHDVTAVYE